MLIDAPGELRRDKRERQSESHLDGETIGGSVEFEEQKPIDGLSHSKTGKDDSHADESQGEAIERSKFH